MPAQGEQHQCPSSGNPFDEVKPHVSEYTASEIATLSSRLEKQLGPEYISSRPGAGGGKVHYLSADKCINLANEVFGFNGWSSSIQQIQIDFVDDNQTTGKVSLGLSVIVRVTLRDGTFHEDIGYGHIENCKGKAPAFEKAKKEGTTDGLKRALRNFGNLLGNCVYDKDYVAKVTKLKTAPTRWDPDNLHRHHDFAPVKSEHQTGVQEHTRSGLPPIKREPGGRQESHEDEFGSDDFDEVDFAVPQGEEPDSVTLEQGIDIETIRSTNREPRQLPAPAHRSNHRLNHHRNGSPRLRPPTATSAANPQTPATARPMTDSDNKPRLQPQPQPTHFTQPPSNVSSGINVPANSTSTHTRPPPPQASTANPTTNTDSVRPPDSEAPVGFFTARAAEALQKAQGPSIKAPTFNPHLESPSIRKTAGVDHTKSKPINRDLTTAPATPVPPLPNGAIPTTNLQTDKVRKLGMPGGGASPLQNRGSYKPPQMKRAADGGPESRPALGDVTKASVNASNTDRNGDAKRPRIDGGHDSVKEPSVLNA